MALVPTPTFGPTVQTPDSGRSDSRLYVERNPRKGRIELLVTRDGGKTRKVLLSEPVAGLPIGSCPQITENGDVEWLPPRLGINSNVTVGSVVATPTTTSFIHFQQVGSLVVNQTFGYYRNSFGTGQVVVGAQCFLQSTSSGADVSFVLVNDGGIEQPQTVTVGAGIDRAVVIFSTALTLNAGTGVSARVKTVGTVRTGECLSVRLIVVSVA